MLKLIVPLVCLTSIVGCSSTPQNVAQEPYCYTDETVVNSNGSVNSTTTLQCSDNPFKRAKLVGVDMKNCRTWRRTDVVGGYEKNYGGYICRDAKGVWRPLTDY
jgi:hypothetical protein